MPERKRKFLEDILGFSLRAKTLRWVGGGKATRN